MHRIVLLPLLFLTQTAADTRVVKPDFSITLPGAWTERPSKDGFDFVSPERGLQVFIAVRTPNTPMDEASLASVTEKLLEIHRRSADKLAEGKAEFEAAPGLVGPGSSRRALAGLDRGHSVRFYTSIHGVPSKIITISFYKYSLAGSAAEFRQWAAQVLQSLKLSGT